MSDIDSRILAREVGKIGGFGARWAARLLPTVSAEASLEFPVSVYDAQRVIRPVLTSLGNSDPELAEFSVITGGGRLNLNPCIVAITIVESNAGVSVNIRAVAKEGLVKQQTAQKVLDKVVEQLRQRFA